MSPISFFKPDYQLYPEFKNAQTEFIKLKTGDCVFLPAYVFYQI